MYTCSGNCIHRQYNVQIGPYSLMQVHHLFALLICCLLDACSTSLNWVVLAIDNYAFVNKQTPKYKQHYVAFKGTRFEVKEMVTLPLEAAARVTFCISS